MGNKIYNFFKDIFGHEHIQEALSLAIKNQKLHHAYLFCGQKGVGKGALAIEFIKIINCKNSSDGYCGKCKSCLSMEKISSNDLLYIFPDINKRSDTEKVFRENRDLIIEELAIKGQKKGYYKFSFKGGKVITVNQIREIKNFIKFVSLSELKKFVVINNAELMNKEAQNSLLKILEEPPRNFHFILLTENKAQLLTTVLSRCQTIEFQGLPYDALYKYLQTNYKLDLDEQEIIQTIKQANGSIDALQDLLSSVSSNISIAMEKLYNIFAHSSFPNTIREIAILLEEISKTLSFEEIKNIAEITAEKLISNIYTSKASMINKIGVIELVSESFTNYIYMLKRNVNHQFLLINLYITYKEGIKKWKI